MRTAQERLKRINRLMDLRVNQMEKEFFSNRALRKAKISANRWAPVGEKLCNEILQEADMAIQKVEDAIHGENQEWLQDFAKSHGIH